MLILNNQSPLAVVWILSAPEVRTSHLPSPWTRCPWPGAWHVAGAQEAWWWPNRGVDCAHEQEGGAGVQRKGPGCRVLVTARQGSPDHPCLRLYPGRNDSACFRGCGTEGVRFKRSLAHSYSSPPVCAIYTVGDTQENAQIGPEVLTPPCHKLSFSREAEVTDTGSKTRANIS